MQVKIWKCYSLFTLHMTRTGSGIGNKTGTIGNNGSWFLSLSLTSVNSFASYIRTH